jgi:hypothetical protein
MFSEANEEKVVKPPQKPVISNNFKLSLLFFEKIPIKIPINKQPIKLTIKVLKGN